MQPLVRIYNHDMALVAILENAFNVGFEQRLNELWMARFSLPADDPKVAACQPMRFVEIRDGQERIDLFRIVPTTTNRSASGLTVTYQLEHVLATLIDDLLFQHHERINQPTYEVLQYILDRQSVGRWQLGQVDFDYQFSYRWENENLLAALLSVPKAFAEWPHGYRWAWDTTTYPWTLHLVEATAFVGPHIRYRRNLRGVTKVEDPTDLITRLYPLGYGEGVNQLTIAGVNDGVPYLDADTQAVFGVISRVYVNSRVEDPTTLKAEATALLEQSKLPRISYSVQAADLYRLTGDPLDKFELGAKVRIFDDEVGIDFTATVVGLSKRDVGGSPGDLEIEIANRAEDVAGDIARLADRQRVQEVYSQGATNMDSRDFADNCDPQNPAVLRFYIPAETVRINKCVLSYESGAFRAFARGAAAGGSALVTSVAGGSAIVTSGDGGSALVTAAAGGAYADTTVDGGYHANSTGDGGGDFLTSGVSSYGSPWANPQLPPDWMSLEGGHNHGGSTGTVGTHNHGIANGTELRKADGGTVVFVESGGHAHGISPAPNHAHWRGEDHKHHLSLPDHQHTFSVPNHSHSFSVPTHMHDVTIPDHTHYVTIPDHTHDVSIPEHTHEMVYGIFQGPTPTSVTVEIDGSQVPGLNPSETEVDLVPYLAKDEAGRILRGAWHEIRITPDDLGRIVASVIVQLFVQSRGGGDH